MKIKIFICSILAGVFMTFSVIARAPSWYYLGTQNFSLYVDNANVSHSKDGVTTYVWVKAVYSDGSYSIYSWAFAKKAKTMWNDEEFDYDSDNNYVHHIRVNKVERIVPGTSADIVKNSIYGDTSD